MEIKVGDIIKTLVDLNSYWGDINFTLTKGSQGVVCEIYDNGTILIETIESKDIPFALVTLNVNEYEKLDD